MLGRNLVPEAVSSAPVFHLAKGEGAGESAKGFEQALAVYKADRGWQREIARKDQTSLTTFYFEWDRVGTGPLMSFTYHSPEVCNVASGLTFEGKRPTRVQTFSNGQKLSFDATAFKTPNGLPVHVFKATWLQGVGGLELRQEYNRIERLREMYGRQVGQARVLEGGIFGASDDNQAWEVFQDEVLSQVQWTDSRNVE